MHCGIIWMKFYALYSIYCILCFQFQFHTSYFLYCIFCIHRAAIVAWNISSLFWYILTNIAKYSWFFLLKITAIGRKLLTLFQVHRKENTLYTSAWQWICTTNFPKYFTFIILVLPVHKLREKVVLRIIQCDSKSFTQLVLTLLKIADHLSEKFRWLISN